MQMRKISLTLLMPVPRIAVFTNLLLLLLLPPRPIRPPPGFICTRLNRLNRGTIYRRTTGLISGHDKMISPSLSLSLSIFSDPLLSEGRLLLANGTNGSRSRNSSRELPSYRTKAASHDRLVTDLLASPCYPSPPPSAFLPPAA